MRHFGLYAAGNVNSKLALARTAIEQHSAHRDHACPEQEFDASAVLDWRELFRQLTGIDLATCPNCGSRLNSEPLPRSTVSPRAPPVLHP